MHKPILIVATIASLLLPLSNLYGQNKVSNQIDSLFSEMNRLDSPGAAVLVVKNGMVLHRKGYGSANLEHHIPITPQTVFDIASVSKQFTGIAISILVEEELINLDDDIRDYIPEIPDFSQKITIRHLIYHTSGLRDFIGTLGIAGWKLLDIMSYEQILTMAYNQKNLNFIPGERYLYSNTGYIILAEIISRITGQPFREWIHQNIFTPLGMDNTYIPENHIDLIPSKAYGYDDFGSGYKAIPNSLTAYGASSIFTTIDDLAKWITNFDSHKIGNNSILDRIMIRGTLNNGDHIDYGFGLMVSEFRGQPAISHDGDWPGVLSKMLYFPDQHLGIVILGNHNNFNPSKSAYQIAEMILSDVLSKSDKNNNDNTVQNFNISIENINLDDYVGIYRLEPGWYEKITNANNQLMIQDDSPHQPYPMIATAKDVFDVAEYQIELTFFRDANGNITYFDTQENIGYRVDEWNPSINELHKFEGHYFSKELDTSYILELHKNLLIAKHRRNGEVKLHPKTLNEFVCDSWFASGFQFVFDDAGNVKSLLISNHRSLNNEFERISH